MACGSSTVGTRRRRPPHCAQANTSTLNARAINCAQAQWRRHCPGVGARPVGGLRGVREAGRRGLSGLREHDARAPPGVGSEHPVVQDEIDARTRDQGGELFHRNSTGSKSR